MPRTRPGTDYGPAITRPGLLDLFPRAKSRMVARAQAPILAGFGRLRTGSRASRLFARAARRLVGGFLYSIKVEVNDRCTQSCRICYIRKGQTELSLETINRLCRSIRACGVRIEILGGEPLLHPGLPEIIRAAKHLARSPYVTLYTNGILATDGLPARLKEAGLDGIIVSLMSQRADVHDSVTRSPGSWEAAVAGVRRLRESGLKVFTFTPIMSVNAADVPAIYDFVRDTLRASALFYQYIPRSEDDGLNISREEWRQAKRWVQGRDAEHWDFVRRFDMLTGNSCSGGNFVLTVKADGSVQPCPFVDDVPMGSIYEDDIWTIYRRRFSDPRLVEFKTLPPECRTCSHRSVCGGGCRAAAQAFGGYGRRDPKCLGPHAAPITEPGVLDCIPTFF